MFDRARTVGILQVEYTYIVSSEATELVCESLMTVPAANPCPWSRDCTLLGEVSFKLRAVAMVPGWVDSDTTSGLYTFIQPGFPRWMNTRDSCGGWRQSSAHPHVRYAISERTVWDTLAAYDCPPGYHWASTAEGVELLGYEGDTQVAWAAKGELWTTSNQGRHEERFARHFEHTLSEQVGAVRLCSAVATRVHYLT